MFFAQRANEPRGILMSTMHVRPTLHQDRLLDPEAWVASPGTQPQATPGIQREEFQCKARPRCTLMFSVSRQETSAVDQSNRGSRSFPKKTRQLKDVQYRSLRGSTKHILEARIWSKMPKQKKEALASQYHADLRNGQCSWLIPCTSPQNFTKGNGN